MPKINDILYIQVISHAEEESTNLYKSRIADINEYYILMEIPINEKTGRLKRLFAEDRLSIYFLTDGGVKNFFTSTVLGFKEDNVRLVVIGKPEPESITRVQRRNFLRVPASLEVALKLADQMQFLAITDDISGGGLSFICDGFILIEKGDSISGWILIPHKNGSIEHAFFQGEAIRIKQLENGKNLVMLKFTSISEAEQQKIMRFCFERQFDFRKG